ncbi:hypothetical protein FRX31_026937 [Thalictrum thalictroides]|uniref:Uncharacterized protein n=1 Tax=Thalictrum thalictroides TaxID=46969 RepID=A0A7J6VGR5_THATH|nr:hypothetical protein FRX31_026937 [Thalictrum thalictroides]
MPSADWREVADNWFGACCCSFGGISENNEELTEHVFPDSIDRSKADAPISDLVDENNETKSAIASRCDGTQSLFSQTLYESTSPNNKSIALTQVLNSACRADENLSFTLLKKERMTSNLENERENYVDTPPYISSAMSDFSGNTTSAHKNFASDCINPLRNQKALLNISLGNGFMVRNSNLSQDVDWNELRCPQCSSVFGAYLTTNEVHASADGGVRLFKCCTSTGLPVGGSKDIFRILGEWATKNQADEIFMFRHQVKELIESLNSAMDSFPSSCSSMQGLSLSFIEW